MDDLVSKPGGDDTPDAPFSEYEQNRLAALRRYGILDTPPEAAFDDITRLAAAICQTPIALINFIDQGRQWFKSERGLGVSETPLDTAICIQAILQSGLTLVPDLTRDPRFACSPLVTGPPHFRFYAGFALETAEGYALGTLCVLDYVPRQLTKTQQDALAVLG